METSMVDVARCERMTLARPAERPSAPGDSAVPVKQLLRWQDDGGALPPGG